MLKAVTVGLLFIAFVATGCEQNTERPAETAHAAPPATTPAPPPAPLPPPPAPIGDHTGAASAASEPAPTTTSDSARTPSTGASEASPDPASSAPIPSKLAAFLSQSGPVFMSVDGRYRLRAPGWKPEKSKDERNVLRVVKADFALNFYEEKKIDFTATNLDQFMTHEIALKKKYSQMLHGTVTSLTVGGRPARQAQFDVVIDDNRWREMLTIIEFPQEYLEVSIVVKPSQVDNKSMQVLVDTVEAVPTR